MSGGFFLGTPLACSINVFKSGCNDLLMGVKKI